jgi:hypothetical protein
MEREQVPVEAGLDLAGEQGEASRAQVMDRERAPAARPDLVGEQE